MYYCCCLTTTTTTITTTTTTTNTTKDFVPKLESSEFDCERRQAENPIMKSNSTSDDDRHSHSEMLMSACGGREMRVCSRSLPFRNLNPVRKREAKHGLLQKTKIDKLLCFEFL